MKPRTRMTALEQTFWEYNSRWFHFSKKKLKTLLSVEWKTFRGDEKKRFGCNMHYRTHYRSGKEPDTVRIFINRRYRGEGRTWKLTLLHEMAHFAVHGKDKSRLPCGSRLFTREMKRLARIGALNHVW